MGITYQVTIIQLEYFHIHLNSLLPNSKHANNVLIQDAIFAIHTLVSQQINVIHALDTLLINLNHSRHLLALYVRTLLIVIVCSVTIVTAMCALIVKAGTL
jgi:hypothetical protein